MRDILQNDKYINDDIQLSSREVAIMLGLKQHSKLFRKIAGLSSILTQTNIGLSNY